MEIALTYLGLVVALIYHLVSDFHKRQTGHPIRHWLSALLAVTTSCIIGLLIQFTTEYQWWQFAVYSLSVHAALFDPIWNLVNKEKWYYAGTWGNPNRAWTDKFWSRVPPGGQILFRGIILILGNFVYYRWDQIIAKYYNG